MQHIRYALCWLTGTTAGMATLPFVLLIAPMRALSCLRLPSAPMAATAAAGATRLKLLLVQPYPAAAPWQPSRLLPITPTSSTQHLADRSITPKVIAVQTGRGARSCMQCARKAASRGETGQLSAASAKRTLDNCLKHAEGNQDQPPASHEGLRLIMEATGSEALT